MMTATSDPRFENSFVQRRRILVIPSEYPDIGDPVKFNGSWAEEQTRALAKYHDLAVVYPILVSNDDTGSDDLDYHGVRTLIVKYRHARKTWISPYVYAAWKGLKKISPILRPECIHAHGIYPAGFASVLIGRAARIPVVITEHWGCLKDRTAESKLICSVLKFTMRNAAKIVAVSEFSAAEMREIEPRCAPVVVPNVVSEIFFDAEPTLARRAEDCVELLFVGSIRDYRKGLDVLLRALRIYLDSPDARRCHLTIIGDGGKRAEFVALADQLQLRDSCEFWGDQSRERVAQAMTDCDIFAMPSRYETFGVVYAEAITCGKPVIACLGGPAEEIVPSWAGSLVPPGDPAALAGAIGRVISGLRSYDARAISDYAKQNFSPEIITARISDVYERAIQARKR